MAMTVSLNATISASDGVTGNTALSKVISQGFAGVLADYLTNLSIPTSATPLTLPTATVQFVYIKNTGANPVQVSWTPRGGVSAIVTTLAPNSFLILVEASAVTGGGVTAISCTAVTAASTIEYVLGG